MKKAIILLLFICSTSFADNKALEIVKKMDALYRSDSSYSSIEMKIETKHFKRTLNMKVWTEGLDKTFVRIVSPKKDKGVSTLRIKTEMWNYLPKTNKTIKIPPSMMMSSWMGSDFTNDDLAKEFTFTKDYTFKTQKEDSENIYIECIPREDLPVVWNKIVIAVEKKELLPVYYKYYDDKDMLIRTMEFSDIKMFGKVKLPAVMTIFSEKKKENRTSLIYKELKLNNKNSEGIFSLRNLRKKDF